MARRRERITLAADTFELRDKSDDIFGEPANRLVYDPDASQRIRNGSWVMITRRLPPIEGQIDKHIRVGRLFFAEHMPNADEFGFLPDGTYKIKCNSPWGTVCLWPYEYSAVSIESLLDMWTEGDLTFHPVNLDQVKFNEVAFYARSRGISLGDAAVMALGTLSGAVGWFEPSSTELAQACEAMAARVNTRVGCARE